MKTKTCLFLTFLCLSAVGPKAQAVSPTPDGGYPGGNTAEGQNALSSLTSGTYNTAVGFLSLTSSATNNFNTAIGAGALLSNTGDENTATGAGGLLSNSTGFNNTANGAFALFNNTTGSRNTATGVEALKDNTTGVDNTATGFRALMSNTGVDNTANGGNALENNTTGIANTATGFQALVNNTTGGGNTAIGVGALFSNTAGSGNTALGVGAGTGVTMASNVICIVAPGADVSGSCFIANIRGTTTQNNDAIPVLIDSQGQLGTTSSSRRFKKEIQPMDKASESILALKPVRFRYKVHKDSTPHFGLIAEEVAEVNRDLVIYDAEGKPYTVRYDAVNAMLLNEFLKEHRKVQEQEATITQLNKDFRATVAQLTTRLDEQAAQIQKVSAQLETSKPAPQVVNNP